MIEEASTSEAALRRLFARFDKDNSGKLSRQEMKRVFVELGVKATDAEIQELVFGLDKSNDGLCSYNEFLAIAYPSHTNPRGSTASSTGSTLSPTSSLVTLLSDRLKEMIRRASGSERELRALFSKFDVQNTGRLTRSKFQKAFANMGLSAPSKEVQELIDSMDTNGDGMVSYGEFINMVHNGSNRRRDIPSRVHEVLQRLVDDNSWTRSSIRRLFLSFDKDNSGYITRSEFRRVFNDSLKVRASDSEIDELIRTIDTNRDGRISYSEFIDMAYQGRNSTRESGGRGGNRGESRGGNRGESRGENRGENRGRGYDDENDRRRDRRDNNNNGGVGGRQGELSRCVRFVDKDLIRQLHTDMPWGVERALLSLFEQYDKDRSGWLPHAEFVQAVQDMNLRVDTARFVKGLVPGLGRHDDRDALSSSSSTVPYRDFVTFMCTPPLGNGGLTNTTTTNNTMNNTMNNNTMNNNGIARTGGFSQGPGMARALTPQELFQEDIAAATAAARTVHAAADQMSLLRNENRRLRQELSGFNVQFFEEIEGM